MTKYVWKRLLLLIPTILGVMFIVYTILSLTPGTPGKLILGQSATPEAINQLNEELGFNNPFLVRFFDYIVDALHGDFGVSYNTQRPVFDEIFPRFPTTVIIAFLSVISAAIVGIPIGILSAVKQYSFIDGCSTTLSLFMAGIPSFWLGLMLMLVFSLQLGWLPPSGTGSWENYVLPTLTLCITGSALIVRITRTMMLETIRQDYIRTARAKGASEKRVIFHHALKNALLPVITSLGIQFGGMLGGTIVIESVFSLPGLGTLIVDAIRMKDIPLVMASVIFLAVLFCLILLLMDLFYAFIDPRVKAQYVK